MDIDYRQRLAGVIARRTAPVEVMAKSAGVFNERSVDFYQASPKYEIYDQVSERFPAIRYTLAAMARLDPRYTEITIEQGERVRKQLERAFDAQNIGCDFDYQGSVTNDTHIKSYSDIDLLCITKLFTALEPPQSPENPYLGNPLDDLIAIRETGAKCLRQAFPAATVDETGSKSVAISGGSLSRKIDIVPANWYDTNQWAATQAKRFRAIQVLDLKSRTRIKNSPFMHNYLIEMRDRAAMGGLRKVVRMMKTLRSDNGNISLSSYDITSIGYCMPQQSLSTDVGGELSLLHRLSLYLDTLLQNHSHRQSLDVPDGSRKIFASGHATLESLKMLHMEVERLAVQVRKEVDKTPSGLARFELSY